MSRVYPSQRTTIDCARCATPFLRKTIAPFCSDLCRFMAKVQKAESGCWNWIGALSGGYAQFRFHGVRSWAHRVSHELFIGPIPPHLDVDHLCRNTRCVNPAHLEAVTHRENFLIRGFTPPGIALRTNRCKRGHEFTPENTYIRPDIGTRQCRACAAMRQQRRHRSPESHARAAVTA